MKTFRRPFKKSGTAFDVKFALITFVLLWGFAACIVGFTIRGILASIVFVFILVQLDISRLYYFILLDDKLIVQNGVYSFWRKEVRYVDIVKVKIKWWQDRTYPYIKIIARKPSGISWRYTIDLVDPQDYKALIEAIEAEGVKVETKGLDVYARIYKDEDKSKLNNENISSISMEHEFVQDKFYTYFYSNHDAFANYSCYHAIRLDLPGGRFGVLYVVPDLFYPSFLRDIIRG